MPCALAIRLIPEADLPCELATGRAAHGLAFDLLGRANPLLADRLHAMPVKPFATAPLVDADGRRPPSFAAGRVTWMRLALLEDELYPAILAGDLTGTKLRMGNVPLAWAGWAVADAGAPVEVGAQPYSTLWGDAATGPTLIRLAFRTPTAISQGDADLPLPVPAKLWAGYATRWRTFAPEVQLPNEIDEGLERWLRLSNYEIRPARWRYAFPDGAGGTRLYTHLGFLGWIEVTLDRKATRAFAQAARALAAFSFYAGSGMKTTMGMGQTTPSFGRDGDERLARGRTP